MRSGPGVDRIERLEALSFPDGCAGTVLCLNVIEHAWEFRTGVDEIVRITAPGGLALMTTAFAIRVHGYPEDYWRFTPRAMERLFEGFPSHLYGWQSHEKDPHLVFALGLNAARDDMDQRAEAWREATLARWGARPPLRVRIGAAFGGAMFGKRHFRTLRHFGDLSVRVGGRSDAAGER
jgi:SAM-dependent methyltransferase